MGGKMSRNKGLRGEYLLRDHMIKLGYEAIRVPSTCPLTDEEGRARPDVVAAKDGVQLTFEMKARKESFKTLYHFFTLWRRSSGVVTVAYQNQCFAIGTDFEGVKSGALERFSEIEPTDKDSLKIFKRVVALDKLRKGADFLVLKDNNRPLLFIRYWL